MRYIFEYDGVEEDIEAIVKEGEEIPSFSVYDLFSRARYFVYDDGLYRLKPKQYEKYLD